jgi:hypothetical protein
VSTHEAKKITREALDRLALPYTRLSARTVDFTDLARASAVFVTVHGWQPSPRWEELKADTKGKGFILEARSN